MAYKKFKGIRIKLRQKPISGNRLSLYLDFYPAIQHPETGLSTRREFLGMYLFHEPKDQISKDHNEQILIIAERIRCKRIIDLNDSKFDNENPTV